MEIIFKAYAVLGNSLYNKLLPLFTFKHFYRHSKLDVARRTSDVYSYFSLSESGKEAQAICHVSNCSIVLKYPCVMNLKKCLERYRKSDFNRVFKKDASQCPQTSTIFQLFTLISTCNNFIF